MISFLQRCREKLSGLEKNTFGLFRTDLSSLLASAASASTLGERIQWLEGLLDWIRISSAPDNNGKVVAQIQTVRVRFFLQSLERNPAWKKTVSRLLVSVLVETEAVSLLCETGLHTGDGFFSEATDRFMHRVIPMPKEEKELSELFSRLFSEESDADWMGKIDEPTLNGLLALLFEEPNARTLLERHYEVAVSEALTILSSHLESLGLSPEIRKRSHVLSVRESAFYRLRMAIASALNEGTSSTQNFSPLFLACREEMNSVLAHLEEQGVSVRIVYRLEKMERYLVRLESLVEVFFIHTGAPRIIAWTKLLSDLVKSRVQSDHIRTLIQHNLRMLARKIVERTGASGEHYITQSKEEYFKMLLSAGGGGVLTAGTAYIKFLISKAHPALFFEGFFSWLNYSGSFLLMQTLHFTLATKQPSMTAPALAAKLKESQGSDDFSILIARLTRSQFAAALGNIGVVIPTAIAANFLYHWKTGRALVPVEYAEKVVNSLHPFESLTIPYAALTGIILWLSSIGGGWLENWFVYRRLPETITQSPKLASILGSKRAARLSLWICKNVAGIGSSIFLGLFLAFTPIIGHFFGLPIDVRHVTLSTGALTFAFCSLPTVSTKAILLSALSILLIGLMNFGVSFAAALYIALKARSVKRARLLLLRRAFWSKAFREPLSFIFPIIR